MTLRVVVAHQSGDGVTIYHCPFCGSGQVIGRSDGNTECQFCNQAFLVRVQPMYSAFPQSVDGMPIDIPGMPDPVPPGMEPGMPGEDPNAMPGEDPNAMGGGQFGPGVGNGTPGGEGGPQTPTSGPDSGGGDDDSGGGPPFGKKQSVFTTRGGQVLPRQSYVAYLASLLGGGR